MRTAAVLIMSVMLLGCDNQKVAEVLRAAAVGFAAGVNGGVPQPEIDSGNGDDPETPPVYEAPSSRSNKLMLFGGYNQQTYLGCLNCPETAADSIRNEYGQHGSAYSGTSIRNHMSEFGSLYSSYSACAQFAHDPPVIVDASGHYYGRLTLNEYHSQIGVGKSLIDVLQKLCDE